MNWLLALALMLSTGPALAAKWYFEASLEGGAEFWTFTNDTGEVSPRRVRGNEIWIVRTDQMNDLAEDGRCTVDNCEISVTIAGQAPRQGEPVHIRFSTGQVLDFIAPGGESLMNNYATVGMATTQWFVEQVRRAQWVDIQFGDQQHRFGLKGSAAALDAIRPYVSARK